ncbi:MAG: SRPBCC domain-containing protein [Gemmatimonadota bacterium]
MTEARADHTGRAVDVEIVTRATPARAWEAWTDPARITEWFADRATGFVLPNQVLRWSNDRLKAETTYTVLSATPPTRLLLESTGGPTPSRLEVEISPAREGTRIRLIHSGFPLTADFDEHYVAVASGWRMAIAVLRYYLEFQFGRTRQSFFVCRPVRYSGSRLASLYRDPAGLQEWLTEAGSLGTPGGRVHLVLKGGRILRGDMLADTGTEVAMGWDEINGVLEFKSFPWDRDNGMRAICVRGWGWELSADQAREIEVEIQSAVDRLETALEVAPLSATSLRI